MNQLPVISGQLSAKDTGEGRRGLTLIELLVVLVIITLVTAAAIPMMAPQGGARRQREAARMVASFLQGARSRAMETGRPVGVIFEWFPPGSANPQPFSMNLSYGQVPPPYAGDWVESRAKLIWDATSNQVVVQNLGNFTASPVPDLLGVQKLRLGDLIKFNYQGALYVIDGYVDPSTQLFVDQSDSNWRPWKLKRADTGAPCPFTIPASGYLYLPYQIIRQPVRSASGPLQLPEGAIIDMAQSGSGLGTVTMPAQWMTDPPSPPSPPVRPAEIVITFSPDGSVGHILNENLTPSKRMVEPVALLIGKREKSLLVPAGKWTSDMPRNLTEAQYREKYNFKDPENFWVVINPNGSIATGEVAASNDSDFFKSLGQSRAIARTGESVGGR